MTYEIPFTYPQLHRDTEKITGMFGTLVVQLPSDFEGGQLNVHHQGKQVTFDFSGVKASTDFHYAVFYADCPLQGHQGVPSLSCLQSGVHWSGILSHTSGNTLLVDQVEPAMRELEGDDSGPPMVAYALAHKYSEASLSFQALKNVDRAVAYVLRNARKEVRFNLYLAKVTLSQVWSGSAFPYGGYETDELADEVVTARNLVSPSGESKEKELDDLTLDKDAVMPGDVYDVEPDKEECEEATGNEGATIDKLYQNAALLVWPQDRHIAVLGLDKMIQKLDNYLSE